MKTEHQIIEALHCREIKKFSRTQIQEGHVAKEMKQ
jgi:hypothetical protein